jgi:hypothetical protein
MTSSSLTMDWYAQRLIGVLESMPIERAVLDLCNHRDSMAFASASWLSSSVLVLWK